MELLDQGGRGALDRRDAVPTLDESSRVMLRDRSEAQIHRHRVTPRDKRGKEGCGAVFEGVTRLAEVGRASDSCASPGKPRLVAHVIVSLGELLRGRIKQGSQLESYERRQEVAEFFPQRRVHRPLQGLSPKCANGDDLTLVHP